MSSHSYQRLLCDARPEIAESPARYDEFAERLASLVHKRQRRTASETRLMKLLALLVEEYDRRHAMPPDDAMPGERLRYLLEVSGKSTVDLLPIFGQRSHVNEAINGKRKLSAEQARKLGVLFNVRPGFFI